MIYAIIIFLCDVLQAIITHGKIIYNLCSNECQIFAEDIYGDLY